MHQSLSILRRGRRNVAAVRHRCTVLDLPVSAT